MRPGTRSARAQEAAAPVAAATRAAAEVLEAVAVVPDQESRLKQSEKGGNGNKDALPRLNGCQLRIAPCSGSEGGVARATH